MKELMVRDINGVILSKHSINVDGDDFVLTYDIPVFAHIGDISLIDDEETRKAKEETKQGMKI